VRRTTGVVLTQVVSVAFLAALQFSPWFVERWTVLIGLVGFSWQTTADPTDLIAVLVLLPFWKWLVPAMRALPGDERAPARPRLLEAVVLATSSLFLLATSPARCANSTEEENVVSENEPPHYPGDLTGAEVLARATAAPALEDTGPQSAGCDELSGWAATSLTVELDTTRAVTRHRSTHVDETVSTKNCTSTVDGTAVLVEVPVSVRSADGRLVVNDTATISQVGEAVDGGVDERQVTWSLDYWSDSSPAALAELLRQLPVAAPERFVGARLTWRRDAQGTTSLALDLVRSGSYQTCAAKRWVAP
jgi:hypothetical protein